MFFKKLFANKTNKFKQEYKPFKLEKLNIIIGCKLTKKGLNVIINTDKFSKRQITTSIEQEIMPLLDEIFDKIGKDI